MDGPQETNRSARLRAAMWRVLATSEVRCACGYNLQGSRNAACAECGREIRWLADHESVSPRQELEELLQSVNLPCVACGYDLKDCPGVQCPECGKVLDALELLEQKAEQPYWVRFLESPLTALMVSLGVIGIVMAATTVLQLMKRGKIVMALWLMVVMVFVLLSLVVLRASSRGSRAQLIGAATMAGVGSLVLWVMVWEWL